MKTNVHPRTCKSNTGFIHNDQKKKRKETGEKKERNRAMKK